MRFALSLIIAVMTLASTTEAKTNSAPNKFTGALITYQQFAMLTPVKRVQYLKDLRELLVLMEKNQSKYEVASNGGSYNELKEQIASFIQMADLLPQAAADTVGPIEYGPNNVLGQTRAAVPTWNPVARQWICYSPGSTFDATLGVCVLKNAVGNCPEGTRSVDYLQGTERCVLQQSWDELSDARQREISKGVRFPSNFFENESPEFGHPYVLGRGNLDIYALPKLPAAGTAITGGNGPVAGQPPAVEKPAPAPVAVAPNPAAPAAPAEPAPAAPAAPAEPAPAAPAPAASCRVPEMACSQLDESAKTNLIARFRQDRGSNICVAGGYFTQYKTPQKKAGTCKVETELRLTAADPKNTKNPNGTVKKCGKEDVGGGVMKDTAMCNPTVFCLALKINDKVRAQMVAAQEAKLKRKVDPKELDRLFKRVDGTSDQVQTLSYCAPVSQDLTRSCNTILQEHIDGKRGAAGFEGAGYEYVQCDPMKLKGFPLQNEWDRLAANTLAAYKAQCGDAKKSQFQALFCEECKIIGERIFAMNQKAVGVGCSDAAPSAVRPAPAPVNSGEGAAIREEGAG